MEKSEWKIRRKIVIGTLLFCASIVLTIIVSKWDSPTAQVALFGSFGLAFTTIGSYVFGAVWDDKNFMESLK